MATVNAVVTYLSSRHPQDIELTDERMLLLLYLADWRSAITRKVPVTDITWRVEDFGPQPDAVLSCAMSSHDRKAMSRRSAEAAHEAESLTADEREVIEFVLGSAAHKSQQDLVRLVYSTFPIMTQPKHAPLSLVALAERYNRDYRYAFGA
jgi:hypothetical protein